MSVTLSDGDIARVSARSDFSSVLSSSFDDISLRFKAHFLRAAHSVHRVVAPVFEYAVSSIRHETDKLATMGKGGQLPFFPVVSYGALNAAKKVASKIRASWRMQQSRMMKGFVPI